MTGAADALLKIIIEQGERRLAAQCAFADAQDERGGAIINAGVALAAAAGAIAMASASVHGIADALTVGSAWATVGFSLAAAVSMWALRSTGFHSSGFFPADFAKDIEEKKTERDLLLDFVLELQHRLTENRRSLESRGKRTNLAIGLLLATPLSALVLGALWL